MPRSERAKELAAKQKAEAKALRAKKRNSDDPRDWGTWKQIVESYKMTKQYDPKLTWLLLATFVVPIIVAVGLSLAFSRGRFDWIFALIAGILLGAALTLFTLTNRTKKASYQRYQGQPGSGEVALAMLNKKKWSYSSAIAFTRQMDTIHRVLGPCGVVLIGDGDPGRLKKMLTSEARRHEQVLYGVNVTVVQIGEKDGQIPLENLARHIEKMPRSLDKVQIEETKSRLHALDAMKPRVPLPKGPLPTNTKGSRRMMRGH